MRAADTFLDSNVVLYALSSSDPTKHLIALELVSKALKDQKALISFQVVQECLNVATGKLESALPGSPQALLSNYLMPLCRVFPSERLYLRAIEIKSRYRFSFFDSCIVAAALESGANTLLTEDLQHGQVVDGLRIVNPFEP